GGGTMSEASQVMTSDLEIAQAARLRPIVDVAAGLGLGPDDLEPYGRYKAKIHLDVLDRLRDRPNAKYVVVTAITPTPLGEGKTTTTVGLGEALTRIGKRAVIAIRQASQGPVFGIKGGAAGGGRAQVAPMEDLNLHLTGDFHAVAAANNECAAFLDNHLYRGNRLGIDPDTITWRRVLDVNDRALRAIVQGLGAGNGPLRETGFDITAASEVMAILALATDLRDLRARMGRIFLAQTRDGQPVTAEHIGAAGMMTVLMKDALLPNLLQTLEGTPALVHAGPFGNIAHGNSSVVADLVGSKLADYLVTEAGFGADLGAEKFFNIKCRASGLRPDAALLVATIRALKAHSGRYRVVAGRPLPAGLLAEDFDALREGLPNLVKQIENVRLHGVPVVVAVNHFPTDTGAEVALVREAAVAAGAEDAVVSRIFAEGGAGGVAMAEAVVRAADKGADFHYLYPLDLSIEAKIETIATRMYGAAAVAYTPQARRAIRDYTRLGFDRLPVCMAKTHLSLSADPALKGRPRDFAVTVREVRASVGAGFIYPLLGEMMTMPGLGSAPGGLRVDLDEAGRIVGLS
ncbi:MAG TPA: formate--tetrahydrofolate ligase, partial [Thermomicrobiales bacterium]|nr:formate--tetrahydrofolate ligase [Thermomicrobiales bacterium]